MSPNVATFLMIASRMSYGRFSIISRVVLCFLGIEGCLSRVRSKIREQAYNQGFIINGR